MASLQVTNQTLSPALMGEGVIVKLTTAETSKLASLAKGMVCTVSSTGYTGTINFIDLYGTSFEVRPIAPNKYFESIAQGVLSSGEIVTVTLS
jgi:hypothetical protein